MLRVGLSSCGITDERDFYAGCADAGIVHVELSPPQGKYNEVDFKKIRKIASEYGISLNSFHLPFMPFEQIDISSLDCELRRSSISFNRELICKAADIGIDKFVVHPSGEPIAPEDRPMRMEAAKDSLGILAETAAQNGGVICVEDLPRTCLGNCSKEMLELLSADEHLRVCFDTNHLLFEDASDFVRMIGNKIITLHVSDRDEIDERHWLPGEGVLDWPAVYEALRQIGYDGIWTYELSLGPKESISRARDLTYRDFIVNAETIFNGKIPEIVR